MPVRAMEEGEVLGWDSVIKMFEMKDGPPPTQLWLYDRHGVNTKYLNYFLKDE